VVERLKGFWLNHWWFRVLAVWAASRAVSTTLFIWAAGIQGPSYWVHKAHPSYFDFINFWDVEWYQRIFDFGFGQLPGYATHLPVAENGAIQQNAWAFMPGFPLLVRAFTFLTGGLIPWKVLAPTLSLLLSFALALALYKVFSLRLSAEVSLWSVTLFGFWVSSPVLQTGYAETLGLLLLAIALYYLIQHRYFMALPALIGLSITRPGMVSFALMLALMWVLRWWRDKKGIDEFRMPERWKLAILTGLSGVLGLAWPLIAWVATGRQDAYTQTELAWRSGDPQRQLVWFGGFADLGAALWGSFWAPVFVVLVLAIAAWLLFTKSAKALGSELRLWTGAYLLYIFAFFYPQSSTFRILMPAFPLVAAFALRTATLSRLAKWFILVGLTVLQMVWLAVCWVYVSPDFTPP
jgi:hypothetical protein